MQRFPIIIRSHNARRRSGGSLLPPGGTRGTCTVLVPSDRPAVPPDKRVVPQGGPVSPVSLLLTVQEGLCRDEEGGAAGHQQGDELQEPEAGGPKTTQGHKVGTQGQTDSIQRDALSFCLLNVS